MEKLRDTTLVFLIKKSENKITEICLAMKKRSFGAGRWNGVGGKVDAEKETVEQAATREAKEEINVSVRGLNKVAELSFYFPHNPAWNQMAHVYFVEKWEGIPEESEEMRPAWFPVDQIPYSEMWPDDIFWIPEVLKGNKLKGKFEFGEKDIILSKEIKVLTNN